MLMKRGNVFWNDEGERKDANGKGLFKLAQFLEGHIVLDYLRTEYEIR